MKAVADFIAKRTRAAFGSACGGREEAERKLLGAPVATCVEISQCARRVHPAILHYVISRR